MRDKYDRRIEAGRIRLGYYATKPGEPEGAFEVQGPCGRPLKIMVGVGVPELGNWEHVSVSISGKHPPNWEEMAWVKKQFWTEDETVVQFHPRQSQYVNVHPNCLHLWRQVDRDYVLPPQILV